MNRHVVGQLGPYLEGDLGVAERRRVERHLEVCSSCTRTLRELRATIDLLRGMPEPELPEHLDRLVMQRIEEAHGRRPPGRLATWLRGVGGFPLPAPVAAAALGLLVIATVRSVGPSETRVLLGLQSEPPRLDRPELDELASAPPPRRTRPAPTAPLRPAFAGAGRYSANAVGGPGAGRAAPGAARLPSRPDLGECHSAGTSGAADSGATDSGATDWGLACRPWLGGMLTLAQYDPTGFLRELGAVPDPERSAWLGELVRFAKRSGLAFRVTSSLRSSENPRAASLAARFEPADEALVSAE
ncbi:MAG: zf-HC2 domain-containing protein [Myxococcota bacterium]